MQGNSDEAVEDDEPVPRWVKISGLITLVVVAIVLVVHLAGGGFGGHAP